MGFIFVFALSASTLGVDFISGMQLVPRNDGITRPLDAPFIPGATVVGNEIRLPKGGVNVELEIIASGWGGMGDEIVAIQAIIDPSGYLGANATPIQPYNLIPLGYPSIIGPGAFQTFRVCEVSRRDCNPGMIPCAPSEGACIFSPRFLFYPLGPDPIFYAFTFPLGSEYGIVADTIQPGCLVDPGPGTDPFDYGYVGTLILQIPSEAIGTYEVFFREGIDWSFWLDCNALNVNLPQLISARITILDCDQDGVSDGQEVDDGTAEDCDTNFVPDDCQAILDGALDDTDGDGTPDPCDGCPNDPLKIEPGICGCGKVDSTAESDGDGVIDCLDLCPGVDDSVFAPGCIAAIPATSSWGLLILALVFLVAAKTAFAHRHSTAA